MPVQKGGNDFQQVPVHFFNVKELNKLHADNTASGINDNNELQIKVIKEIPLSEGGDVSNKMTKSPASITVNKKDEVNAKEAKNIIPLIKVKQAKKAQGQMESAELVKSEDSNKSAESVISENSKSERGNNESANPNELNGLSGSSSSKVSNDPNGSSVSSVSSNGSNETHLIR